MSDSQLVIVIKGENVSTLNDLSLALEHFIDQMGSMLPVGERFWVSTAHMEEY